MNILFASPEVVPFVKTGGLADVAGSLPRALAAYEENDVRVILPLYAAIGDDWRSQMTFVKYFFFQLGWRSCYCGLFELKRFGVTYYFVDNETYFKRGGLYGHFDDGERFAYFSRAVIETPAQIGWAPDIIHCNDWQTALVPVYLLEARWAIPELAHAKSVYTIHNIEYQGRYGNSVLIDVFGLNYSYFNEGMLSFYNDVNLMKGAIMSANFVTTVSPTYAKELQYAFYAHGLEGVISEQSFKMKGILNGIDMDAFNPEKDTKIAANFSVDDLSGKAKCKAALQDQLGLEVDPDAIVIGSISRLVGHKGYDLITYAFDRMMENPKVQFVLLGTGDWSFEEFFRNAQARYPGRVSANITYSAPLSSAIYAGADVFLMPSIAEPCGLSQMIALRYGTIPIVRLTGGLKDSVPAYNPTTGEGLGFTFGNINGEDMLGAVDRALEAFEGKDAWTELMKRGMQTDFSWDKSAAEYLEIYQNIAD